MRVLKVYKHEYNVKFTWGNFSQIISLPRHAKFQIVRIPIEVTAFHQCKKSKCCKKVNEAPLLKCNWEKSFLKINYFLFLT